MQRGDGVDWETTRRDKAEERIGDMAHYDNTTIAGNHLWNAHALHLTESQEIDMNRSIMGRLGLANALALAIGLAIMPVALAQTTTTNSTLNTDGSTTSTTTTIPVPTSSSTTTTVVPAENGGTITSSTTKTEDSSGATTTKSTTTTTN